MNLCVQLAKISGSAFSQNATYRAERVLVHLSDGPLWKRLREPESKTVQSLVVVPLPDPISL